MSRTSTRRAAAPPARSPSSPLYDADFYAWAMDQARLLRNGAVAQADLINIAEELEDLGRSEHRALRSALARIIRHLLKWDHQEPMRSASWQISINQRRVRAEQTLKENPGLKPKLDETLAEAYELAVASAMDETGLPRSSFPEHCPYGFDEVMTRPVPAEFARGSRRPRRRSG